MKGVFFLDNHRYGGDIKYFTDLIIPFLKKTQNYVLCNELDNYSKFVFKEITNQSKVLIYKKNRINNFLINNKDNLFVKILLKINYLFLPIRFLIHTYSFLSFLKKIKPDFVVSMNGGYPGSVRCLSIIFAAKILGIRNYLVVASIPSKKSFKTFYDTILDSITLTSVEEVIINSKNQLNLFKKFRFFNKKKLFQINNSLIIKKNKFKKINFKKKKIYLGVVARLDKQKKIDKLIKIIKSLQNKKKFFYLNIIGEGSEKKNLYALTKKLELQKYVNFLGFIQNHKISNNLKDIDIFIFPSEDEGLPFSILEAVNLGLPVIAADSGGISENFNNLKEMLILKDTSLEKYVEAIYLLVNNPKFANKIRNKSFIKLKKFYDLKKNQNLLINRILKLR